jgi:4-amino-4-deoxy-L-arabinose transferase-like glycosyltransferase
VPSKRKAVVVGLLLVLALGLRIAEVQRTSYQPVNDAGSYLKLAGQIVKTGDYSSTDHGAGGTRGPSAYFPPAFPYFLAAVDTISGKSKRPAVVQPARISQAILGTVTVALIGLLAFELFGETAGIAALALAAIYPVFIELSGALVAENLLTPLVVAALWSVLRARRSVNHRYWWVAGAGVLCGLAALSHVNGLIILIPLGLALWTVRPRWSVKALAAPALLIALAALTIAPWTIRNAVELHSFVPISDETGITLVGTYNQLSANNHQVPYKWRLYAKLPQDRLLGLEGWRYTEPQLDGKLQSQAFTYIGNHPFAPLVVAFHNTLRMFELEGSFAWRASAAAQGIQLSTAQVGVIGFWILCALALGGAFTKLVRRAPLWVWAVPVLLALSAVLVNMETPRFREPFDAFLILPASCAIATLLARMRGERDDSVGAPVGRDGEAAVPAASTEPVEVV